MKWNRVSRRVVLQGAGGALLAFPWLESMKPKHAQAAGAPVKRFIAMKTYNHPVITKWYPSTPIAGLMPRKDGTLALTKDLGDGSRNAKWATLTELVEAGKGLSANLGPSLN